MLVASLPTLAAHPIQSMFEDRPSRNYYGLCPKIWVTQCFASVLAKIMIPSGNLLLRQDPMACPWLAIVFHYVYHHVYHHLYHDVYHHVHIYIHQDIYIYAYHHIYICNMYMMYMFVFEHKSMSDIMRVKGSSWYRQFSLSHAQPLLTAAMLFLSGGGLYAKLCVVEPGTCVGRRKRTPVCKKPMLTGQCSALRTSAAHIDCMDLTSRWIEFPRPTSPIRRIPCLCQGIPRPCCHQRLRWSTRAEDAAPGCFPRHCFSMVLREEFLIFDFNNFVVGGFNPSEKYEFVSWDYIYMTFPTEWKNKIHVPNHPDLVVGHCFPTSLLRLQLLEAMDHLVRWSTYWWWFSSAQTVNLPEGKRW